MKSSKSEKQLLFRNICENGMECLHEGVWLDENKR